MKKQLLSLTMAAVTAFSCCGTVFAANTSSSVAAEECGTVYEEQQTAALEQALRTVKTRISIPDEMTEFNYRTSTNNTKTVYTFTWNTPYTANEYREISCSVCGSVITRYNIYDYSNKNSEKALAELSTNNLYSYAQKAIKKLDPTVYKNISIDKKSISISLSGNKASFDIVRTKNGVPVANNKGKITIDKNTGELLSFNISWHTNASFKSSKTVISEDKAKDAYAEMIDIYPMYEITYDREKDDYITDIIYVQKDYGEINAFTGKKSDFEADGYYGDETTESEDCVENPETGGYDNSIFTEQELAELNKELPYGTEKDVREILESKDYFIISDDMELHSSNLYKQTEGKNDKYLYFAYFSSADFDKENYWNTSYEDVEITVNAETGEIISYRYWHSKGKATTNTYDEAAAAKLASTIAKDLAGEKLDEYGEMNSSTSFYRPANSAVTNYYGSSHSFDRYVNDIIVSGNKININLNCENKLTSYYISYTDAEFISPEKMLTKDEIMDIYWENNDIDLYYLARVHDKKTKTVLVYGTDSSIYCNAFTGEQIYSYVDSTDLSGIKNASIKKKAAILDAHGFVLSETKFSENDAVKEYDFARALNMFTEMRLYGSTGKLELTNDRTYENAETALTNADAMIMLTAAECGTKVPELGGIFRSPYTDVQDSDKNVGYYAIAYALTNSDAATLDPDGAFTYADMIELIYNYLA